MRSQQTELERYYDRLTPKERAILSLKGWKSDDAPDEALKRSTPQHDVAIVRKYLDTVRDTNFLVGGLVAELLQKLDTIQWRLNYVQGLNLWESNTHWVRLVVDFDMPELLTESQHAERLEETRSELFAVAECAQLLVDIEIEEGDEIEAECRVQEKRVRAAIKNGGLAASRGKVRYGDLADWAGDEVHVPHDGSFKLVVLPDAFEDYVAGANAVRVKLRTQIAEAPGEGPNRASSMREKVLRGIARSLGEYEVVRHSLEFVVAWVSEDFDGEEALFPEIRNQLDTAPARIAELLDDMKKQDWELELPDGVDEQLVDALKRTIARN